MNAADTYCATVNVNPFESCKRNRDFTYGEASCDSELCSFGGCEYMCTATDTETVNVCIL